MNATFTLSKSKDQSNSNVKPRLMCRIVPNDPCTAVVSGTLTLFELLRAFTPNYKYFLAFDTGISYI